jgi:hypothetical protein
MEQEYHEARILSTRQTCPCGEDYTTAWDWIKSFLSDLVALAEGLVKYQAVRERKSTHIRERLEVEFLAKFGQGLELADTNVETRWWVIDQLGVQVVLTVAMERRWPEPVSSSTPRKIGSFSKCGR